MKPQHGIGPTTDNERNQFGNQLVAVHQVASTFEVGIANGRLVGRIEFELPPEFDQSEGMEQRMNGAMVGAMVRILARPFALIPEMRDAWLAHENGRDRGVGRIPYTPAAPNAPSDDASLGIDLADPPKKKTGKKL